MFGRMSKPQARSFVAKELHNLRERARVAALNHPLTKGPISCPDADYMAADYKGYGYWYYLSQQEWKAGFEEGRQQRRDELSKIAYYEQKEQAPT